MSKKGRKNNRYTRYADSVMYFKSMSCKVSLFEDKLISEYCLKNNISKSLFLAAAAMYCINNNITSHQLLHSTATSDNFDYKDYKEKKNYE